MKVTKSRQMFPMNRTPCKWKNGDEWHLGFAHFISVPFAVAEYIVDENDFDQSSDASGIINSEHELDADGDINFLMELEGFTGLVWGEGDKVELL